jgi:hypothetical protein
MVPQLLMLTLLQFITINKICSMKYGMIRFTCDQLPSRGGEVSITPNRTGPSNLEFTQPL